MNPFLLKLLRSVPFARLFIALATGILLQWYLAFSLQLLIIFFAVSLTSSIVLFTLPLAYRYRLRWLGGLFILLLTGITGAYITWQKDVRHNKNWLGNYTNNQALLITLQEPLVNKQRSYKATASANAVLVNHQWQQAAGKLLVYFAKDSSIKLHYGSRLIITRPLQPISNSGNPGAFDYRRYCIFQDITHQVFLQSKDYIVLSGNNGTTFQQFLFNARDRIIKTLQQYIPGNKEQGVAEALLIGYRDDLDKELVQSYSNTGVVHIIAISGLHLGMIYGLLIWIMVRFKQTRTILILKPIIILAVLWLFTLLAGAAPSILRSAVMFTFIVIADSSGRKTNMYNNLAASAFCLLVYNPFSLWDVGFQLSYSAVLSIVIFMRPVYNLLYIKNKWLDKLWQLNSVTIAAQVLTLPFVVYYFHQFPLLFLVTNLLAVPLSGGILFGELLLLLSAFLKSMPSMIGMLLHWFIFLLNSFIELVDRLPFAVWNGLQLSVVQAVMMFLSITTFSFWLLAKNKKGLFACLVFLISFLTLRSVDFIKRQQQQQLIVYNVPGYAAMDIINGRNYTFIGDTILLQDNFLRNFHLKPCRILYRVTPAAQTVTSNVLQAGTKKIMLLGNTILTKDTLPKIPVDIIIVSHNPKFTIARLQQRFSFNQIVFDSSNPLWKIEKWKKDCEHLHLRFHSVPQQGAFVLKL